MKKNKRLSVLISLVLSVVTVLLLATMALSASDSSFESQLIGFPESYRPYLKALHEKYPNLEICANWAFSDHMPEPICANVDFLSGDLDPQNCVCAARYAGRMLALQGKPWDLMSWGFRYSIYGTSLIPPKHPIQLQICRKTLIQLS